MGIAAYFRQIKEEVIAEEVAKATAKAEAQGMARGLSAGRQRTIDELRAMPTHEVLALLERQDKEPDADPAPDPESPSNGNNLPPPA